MVARGFIIELIEKYKQLPCLWHPTHKDYHNKKKRNAALEEILSFYKTKYKDANIDLVKKKLASMRSCFKKELNKVKASARSVTETDDVHIPKLWYYDRMLFLADVDKPENSESVQSIFDDMPLDDNAESSDDDADFMQNAGSMDVKSPSSQTSVASTSYYSGYKRKTNEADAVLSKIAKKLDEPQSAKLKYSSFGDHVAERLRSMPAIMATYCQKIINDAIFMAETGNLNISSHIETGGSFYTQQIETNIRTPQANNVMESCQNEAGNLIYEDYVSAVKKEN